MCIAVLCRRVGNRVRIGPGGNSAITCDHKKLSWPVSPVGQRGGVRCAQGLQLVLLAFLVLHANRAVSRDALIYAVCESGALEFGQPPSDRAGEATLSHSTIR